MMGKEKKLVGRESVKLKREVVEMVRANKKKNYTPVSTFFENAAMKELLWQKAKSEA